MLNDVLRSQRASSSERWQRLVAARWLWVPLLAFVITRLGIMLVAYVSMPLFVDAPAPPPYHLRPDNLILDALGSRWDSGFYLSIASEGYRYQGVALPSVAFFPLLPLLIKLLTPLVGDALIAGLLITNAALLAAMVLLYRLVEDEWGTRIATRSVWYVLIFPTAFFGSALYSESLFLLAAIGTLYAARRGRWGWAALLGIMATLTRLVGLIVAPMLLAEWWMQRQRRPHEQRPSLWALLAPTAAPLGTAGYMLYLQRTFGDPLAFVHASAAWDRVPRPFLTTLGQLVQTSEGGWGHALLAGQIPLNDWIDAAAVLTFLGLAGVLLWQRRWSEGLFVGLGALIALNSGLLMSQRRYMWVLFPAFVLLARWGEHPLVDRIITTLALLGLALMTALYANWYWVA